MNAITKGICELLPSEPCDLYGPHHSREDSRAALKQYILDPVLPVLTLLSMSVLTVVMLVTIVTTVADMDMRLPDSYVSVDPWTGVSLGSAGGVAQDQRAYTSFAAALEPTDDRDFWPAPPEPRSLVTAATPPGTE
jgi:hypothetical protein